MESKKERNNTPKKSMQTILFETVHGKINHNTCSPFRMMPNFSTPPSRFARITNPFEQHLIERLHLPVFSPTVFATVPSPNKTEEKFKWTIEDIASIRPADIDDATIDQQVTNEYDSALEMTAQEKINTFFNENEIVSTPSSQVVKAFPLVTDDIAVDKKSDVSDGMTQTILTLPPILPKHVESALLPYFNYTENQQQNAITTQTELCYKLFNFEDQNKSGSVQTSPPLSIGLLSPIQLSPLDNKLRSSKNFGSVENVPILRECSLSPIEQNKMNSSRRMSVESHFVPDTADQLPPNQSDRYDFPLVIDEVLSDSTVNWDMEYKHITLMSPTNSCNEMDISNSNTPPRSKIFYGQRKKLSDSFMKIETDDNKENIYDGKIYAKTDVHYSNEASSDVGYQTDIMAISEEWTNTHLFASTPTKKKY